MGQYTGNYSRDMFVGGRRYIKEAFQQGKPIVDADENDHQQMTYYILRRFVNTLMGDGTSNNGFQIVGTGATNDFTIKGGDNTLHNPGIFALKGHLPWLANDTTFKGTPTGTTLADFDKYAINSKITAVSYSAGPNQTTITDSSANYSTNELVGRNITPNVFVPANTYAIVANTATTITVSTDVTANAAVGSRYRLELSTPGSNRTDAVYINCYEDEIDSVEDANLLHSFGGTIEAQRRIRLEHSIFVRENNVSDLVDYTDSNGLAHHVYKLATLSRLAANATITSGMVADLRPIVTLGNRFSYDNTNKILSHFNGFTSQLEALMIEKDLTLTVKNSPSATFEFATLNAAMTYLKHAIIPDDVTVTINIQGASIAHSAEVIVQFPYANRIKTIGATPVTKSITSCDTVSGSVGNYSITYTLNNVTSLSIGQYAIIHTTTGGEYKHPMHQSVWEITNISSPQVTVKNTHQYATKPPVTTDITGGSFTVLPSILSFSTGASSAGISILGTQTYIKDVMILRSGVTNYGVNLGNARLLVEGYIGVAKFDGIGINVYNSDIVESVTGSIIASSSNSSGLYSSGTSSVSVSTIIGNGNISSSGSGCASANTSHIFSTNIIACGNNGSGILCVDNSHIASVNKFTVANVIHGLFMTRSSSYTATNLYTVDNGAIGLFSQGSTGLSSTLTKSKRNATSGITSHGSWLELIGLESSSNGTSGVSVDRVSFVYMPSASLTSNTGNAAESLRGSIIEMGSASGNGQLYADYNSYIEALSTSGFTFSPAVNTPGNIESYIRTV